MCRHETKRRRDYTIVDLFLQFLEPACRYASVGPATTGLVLYQNGSDVDGVRMQLVWERERMGGWEGKREGREEGEEGRVGKGEVGGWYVVCDKHTM